MTTAQTMLWEELYRPQTFNDIVLPARIKKQFTTPGIIQNYLFHGPQGTGKSTLAKILAKQYNALFINASLRNDVQSIRTDIDNFCALQSLDSNRFKLVVFDEADHLSQAAQAALRGVIEEYNQTARFIFTCNYPEKLTDPIKSRLEEINFDFANPEEQNEQTRGYISRLVFIASANGMVCDKEAISFIFKKNYPDIRSMIQKLQNLHRSGITHATLNDVQKTSSVKYEDLFTFICNNPNPPQLYTMLSAFKGKEHSIIKELSTSFLQYCANKQVYNDKLGDIAICVHKYSVESKNALDMFVTLLACVYNLSLIVNKK